MKTTPSSLPRRQFVRQSLAVSAALAGIPRSLLRAAEAPIDLGSRRELLVDDYLLESLDGVTLKLHKPEAREVVLTCDRPWEGNTSAYYTLFQDGDRFRIYYRGSHYDETTKKEGHPQFTCYAESRDGITWEKPALGLFEFAGSKDNNIVRIGEGTHNFAPFKDTNPSCKPEERYKALAGGTTLVNGKKKSCLRAYRSADGVRWSLMQDEAVITDGAFDSQNIACFDNVRGEYRAYWRYFSKGYTDERGWKPEGVRAIRTATSKDFINWTNQADLRYGDAPAEHLYTNAVMPYFRAPHLFIAFPTRFQPKHQQVEPVFMTSRDGVNFKRWPEALIPITAPKDRDGNRSNYMTRGLLQLPGHDKELSVYATEAYYTGPGSRVRRFVYRMDGFVSAHTGTQGTLTTKPLKFAGSRLSLNIASRGGTRVEIQDGNGSPLPGFALGDCTPIQGDFIGHHVLWKGGSLSALAGKPVRLRFDLRQADLYSLQFQGEA
jgi:hypothetical protein